MFLLLLQVFVTDPNGVSDVNAFNRQVRRNIKKWIKDIASAVWMIHKINMFPSFIPVLMEFLQSSSKSSFLFIIITDKNLFCCRRLLTSDLVHLILRLQPLLERCIKLWISNTSMLQLSDIDFSCKASRKHLSTSSRAVSMVTWGAKQHFYFFTHPLNMRDL